MTTRCAQTEKTATVLSSLNGAMHMLMSNDQRMVVLGEDILDPYGGAFKVTRGLSACYPDRVFGTPISEAAIVGLACGLALRGFTPVAEIMFGDFLTLAADQLVNHAAKFRWMYDDTVSVPMVVRTPMGGRRGYGPTHSQSLEKHFLGVPGLAVAAINHVADPGELLSIAVQSAHAPVLFIENKRLYAQERFTCLEGWTLERLEDPSALFPTVVLRQRFSPVSDALLFCYGGMAPLCIEAVAALHEDEGLECDLAVFSQLSPVPRAHLASLMNAGFPSLLVYAEESPVESGWGSEMIASIEEIRHSVPGAMLPAPRHVRIGAEASPIAACRALESEQLPQTATIVRTVVECC
ncbi:MAG: alpha-ketoacid dehydrogenase subunit beta [Acidobacteriota bacterium]